MPPPEPPHIDPRLPRYAVLHHTGHGEAHFDLLLGRPNAPLVTLRLPRWPVRSRIPFTRLPDHRPIYLDYEGPISGNRGEVRRVEAGVCGMTSEWILTRSTKPAVLQLTPVERAGAAVERGGITRLHVSIAEAWIEPVSGA